MDYVKITEVAATILTLIGVPIMSIPRRSGMWFLVVAQILWSFFSILSQHYYLLCSSIFVLLCNFYALYSWKKLGIKW
jgi:hypothetical protein